MGKKEMRVQKGLRCSDRTDIGRGWRRDTAGIHNSVLYTDNHTWNSFDCSGDFCNQKKIDCGLLPYNQLCRGSRAKRCLFQYVGGKVMLFMQVVVVKAPKMLRGILRVMFKMKKPEIV